MSLQSFECVAYETARRLALCAELDKARSSPSAIPHMDILVRVLEPLAEAAVAAEAGAESEAAAESVVVVTAAVLPLVDVVGQSQRCCP